MLVASAVEEGEVALLVFCPHLSPLPHDLQPEVPNLFTAGQVQKLISCFW